MARRTAQQWQELIQQHATSGQTATAFCASRGINDKYFSFWKNKLYPKANKTSQTPSKFITLKTPTTGATTETVSLSLGAVTVKIPASTSPHWMAVLIRELG